MLTGNLLNPELLFEVAKCGHGDKILITDGNYPMYENVNEHSRVINLALSENIPNVTDILKSLNSVINIETYELMDPQDGSSPKIFEDFAEQLIDVSCEKLDRYTFYEAAMAKNVRVVVGSAETRTFANILLTVGVR
jgi:L-fucose mutarotase